MEFALFVLINSFNPRTPCGVRRGDVSLPDGFLLFQSTHSLRSATRLNLNKPVTSLVSIHALLAECDYRQLLLWVFPVVSIHALLAECDRSKSWAFGISRLFQSTHSLRSATGREPPGAGKPPGFNPRTPCGVRQLRLTLLVDPKKFQSTHSLRSATLRTKRSARKYIVSIHALLAECDPNSCGLPAQHGCFNPRTPCGVRHAAGQEAYLG